jgi:hypothetical protein
MIEAHPMKILIIVLAVLLIVVEFMVESEPRLWFILVNCFTLGFNCYDLGREHRPRITATINGRVVGLTGYK